MIIDVNTVLNNFKGQPIQDTDGEKLILVDIVTAALNNAEGDGKDKLLRFRLAMRAQAASEDEGQMVLTAKEIVLIQDSVDQLYSPLLVGRVSDILEPPDDRQSA